MSFSYLTSQETAVYKFKENQTTTSTAAWTPRASTIIGITGMFISNGAAAAGTFQIRFGDVGGSIIMNGVLGASAQANTTFPVALTSNTYDRAVYFETGTSASTAGWAITLSGFEYGGN